MMSVNSGLSYIVFQDQDGNNTSNPLLVGDLEEARLIAKNFTKHNTPTFGNTYCWVINPTFGIIEVWSASGQVSYAWTPL